MPRYVYFLVGFVSFTASIVILLTTDKTQENAGVASFLTFILSIFMFMSSANNEEDSND